jgi:hypothetical protein
MLWSLLRSDTQSCCYRKSSSARESCEEPDVRLQGQGTNFTVEDAVGTETEWLDNCISQPFSALRSKGWITTYGHGSVCPPHRFSATIRLYGCTIVDYFWPIEMTLFRRFVMRWGCLLIWLTTRAVHLEMVYALNADAFIWYVACIYTLTLTENKLFRWILR